MLTKRTLLKLAAIAMLVTPNGPAQSALVPVFEYGFPDSYDGTSTTITDLSTTGNHGAMDSTNGYLPDERPPGFDSGGSLTGSNGGHGRTDAIDLLENPTVEAAGGYTMDVWFQWEGVYTDIRKLIDYAGTEALRTYGGNIQFIFDGGVFDAPINGNQWYHVVGEFDTLGNTVAADGSLAGEARLWLDDFSGTGLLMVDSGPVTKTTYGDSLDRPIGINRWAGGGGDWYQGVIYNPAVYLGLTEPTEYTWKVAGHADLTWEGSTNWDPADGPPDASSTALIPDGNAETITVNAPTFVRGLTVGGGGIEVTAGQSLAVATTVEFDADATLALSDGAMFSAPAGSIGLMTTTGNVTVNAPLQGKTISVGSLAAGAGGVLTKAGAGTLALDNTPDGTVVATGATLKVVEGTLRLAGANPAGGASGVEIAGGTLAIVGPIGVADAIPAGAIGHWKLDDGTGSGTAADSAGTNLGVLTNMDTAAAWVPGHTGEATDLALQFDGADDYVDLGTGSSLSGQTDFTVSAWIKTEADSNQVILQQRNGGINGEYMFTVNANGTLGAMLYGDNGYQFNNFSTTATVNDGQWHHAVFSRAQEAGRLYIDGSLAATANGPVRNLDATIRVGMGDDIRDFNKRFNGLIDDVFLYDRALSDEEIATGFGVLAPNVSQLDVTVTGSGVLALTSPALVAFRSLTLQSGIVTVTGRGADFGGTTIDAPADGVVGVDLQAPARLGPIDVVGTEAVTLVKTGPADLVMTEAGVGASGFGSNVTIEVRGGRLVGVHGADTADNPFDAAALRIDGGELILAASAGSATYENPLTVGGDGGTLTAGMGGAAGAAPGALTVTLGTDTVGIALNDGTLALAATDDYRLDVAGPLSGSGGIRVTAGDVTLSGGGSARSATVTGGTLSVAADVQFDKLSVTGGVVDTGANQIVVGSAAEFGDAPFSIDSGHTFTVTGSDLATSRLLTVDAGTLGIGPAASLTEGMVAFWTFDDGTGSVEAADSIGANTGALMNMDPSVAWVPGKTGEADDYALQFDGSSSLVEVPFAEALNGDSFTFGAWARVNGGGYRAIVSSRNEPPTQGYICYVQPGGNVAFWTGPGAGWANLGGPTPAADEWVHVTGTFEAAGDGTGTKTLYVHDADGNLLDSSTATHGYDPNAMRALRIGAGANEKDPNYFFNGSIDNVFIYDRALTAEEVDSMVGYTPSTDPLVSLETDVTITGDAQLTSGAPAVALGDLRVAAGVNLLTLENAEYSFHNATVADGVTVDGEWNVSGTLGIGNGIGEMTVGDGELALASSSVCNVQVSVAARVGDADRITLAGGMSALMLGGELNVSSAQDRVASDFWANATRTIVDNSQGGPIGWFDASDPENKVMRDHRFDTVEPALAGPGEPAPHLGQGAFLRGIDYVNPAGNITSSVDLDVFIAIGGDADGDGKVWLSDWAALRANFGNTGTGKTWTEGNFDPWEDDKVWLSDWAALRANFGNSDYTTAGAAAVPEPGTIAMLLGGLAGLVVLGRRRRREPARKCHAMRVYFRRSTQRVPAASASRIRS